MNWFSSGFPHSSMTKASSTSLCSNTVGASSTNETNAPSSCSRFGEVEIIGNATTIEFLAGPFCFLLRFSCQSLSCMNCR